MSSMIHDYLNEAVEEGTPAEDAIKELEAQIHAWKSQHLFSTAAANLSYSIAQIDHILSSRGTHSPYVDCILLREWAEHMRKAECLLRGDNA